MKLFLLKIWRLTNVLLWLDLLSNCLSALTFLKNFKCIPFIRFFFSISLVPPNRSNVHSFTQMKTLMNFKCNRLLKFLNFTVSGWNLFMQKMLVNLRSLFKSLRYLKIETIHVFVCLTYIMKVNRNS